MVKIICALKHVVIKISSNHHPVSPPCPSVSPSCSSFLPCSLWARKTADTTETTVPLPNSINKETLSHTNTHGKTRALIIWKKS